MMETIDRNPNRHDIGELEESFRRLGKEMGLWRHGYALKCRCKQVFREFAFTGSNMLEIGCGKGLFCIWASIHGAKSVVGLEPLEDGAVETTEWYGEFNKIINELNISNIEMFPKRIQDFECEENIFDIVLSHGSINHLDENSCIHLLESSKARQAYLEIFRKVNRCMKNGGRLIIVEASNRNYFGDKGIRNPFAKTIEWNKHQTPEIWAELLSQCGFRKQKITWNSGTKLRYFRVYSINKKLSYFGRSSFRLEMTAVK